MGHPCSEGDSAVQFVPRIRLERLGYVGSRFSGLVPSDQTAGNVVDAVGRVGETEIQVLSNHIEAAMESHADAAPIGDDVLPAEQIGDPQPVVRVRIYQVEGVVRAVGGILIAAGII